MASFLRYPDGVRPLLIEETARRKRLEARLAGVLDAAAFSEIVLPIIDFAEPYAAFGGVGRDSYRFVDREGDLVAVRSDFTPMAARALAPTLRPEDLPLRVFYRGDVVRCEPSRLGSGRELFQIGAEVVGDASADADVFVMRLAAAIVEASGVDPFVVYTDAAISRSLDDVTLDALHTKRARTDLPLLARQLLSGTATCEDLRSQAPASARRLEEIGSRLSGESRFTLQLDDVEPAGYYTGLRFRVYGRDRRTPVASGGRYDALYGRFGLDTPAVGFTFTLLPESASRADEANRGGHVDSPATSDASIDAAGPRF